MSRGKTHKDISCNMNVHMKFVSVRLGNVEILCKISEQIWPSGGTEEKVR